MKNFLFLNNKSQTTIFNDGFYTKGQLAPDKNENEDLDQQIHNYLIEQSSDEINSFTLPISLNENFLEFSGLIFAHHIRLTTQLKYREATIVFYGILELEELLRLTEWARVLLTANVLYFNLSKYSFEDIKEYIKNYKPKKTFPTNFLEKIQIQRPANYNDGHHSIDNEFALIQWSQHINCYDNLPINFKNEFDSRLFFKYLKQKRGDIRINYPNDNFTTIIGNSKVLLIDDEAGKGWETFYKTLLKLSDPKNFTNSDIDFKKAKEKSEIVNEIEEKIKNFDPDVILLDLRLHDSDFSERIKPEDLTGMKILEIIKEINQGIQVIVTTASNKAWNFNLAKQKGCFDFIIKSGYENAGLSIPKLSSSLKIASKRSLFLKNVGSKMAKIKTFISSNSFLDNNTNQNEESPQKENKLRKKIISNIDLAFDLLDLSSEITGKQKYFAYSYLQLFICIEEYLSIKEIFEYGDKCYVNNDILVAAKDTENKAWDASIKFIQEKNSHYILEVAKKNTSLNPSQTDFKMSAALIYLFNQDNSNTQNWPKVRDTRNKKAAHPEEGNIVENDIITILDFLSYIFNLENVIPNTKKGLPTNITKKDLENLKNKLNTTKF